MYKSLALCGLLFFLMNGSMLGQHSLSISTVPSFAAAQYLQPAYISLTDHSKFNIGLDGGLFLASNSFALDRVQFGDGFIDPAEKDHLVGSMSNDNRLRYEQGYGLIANFKLPFTGNRNWSLLYRQHQDLYFRANNPATAGLILYGNQAYAGQTISDENLAYESGRWSEFGIGSHFQIKKISLALRLKLLLGQNLNRIESFSYSFFTAENGSFLDISSQYNWFQGDQGIGMAADLGLLYPVNKKLMLDASVINLGAISWVGTERNNQVSFVYEGFALDNIFGTDYSNFQNLFALDTIQDLFFPDSSETRRWISSPLTAQVGMRYELDSLSLIWARVRVGVDQFSPASTIPQLSIGYQRSIGKYFSLGTHLSGGGLSRFGWGLMGQAVVPIATSKLRIFVGADHVLGGLAPSLGRALQVHGGIGFQL